MDVLAEHLHYSFYHEFLMEKEGFIHVKLPQSL